jgi:hypothetical protein
LQIDNLLQGMGAVVKIVRVELNGVTSAAAGEDPLIPAAADAEIGSLRDQVIHGRKLPR